MYIRSIIRKMLVMRRAVAFLGLIILVIPGLNIVGSKPVSSSLTYSININQINPTGAAPGNSNKAVIGVSVTQLGDSICGLNEDNFKLDTLKAPFYCQNIVIYSVGAFLHLEVDPILRVITR